MKIYFIKNLKNKKYFLFLDVPYYKNIQSVCSPEKRFNDSPGYDLKPSKITCISPNELKRISFGIKVDVPKNCYLYLMPSVFAVSRGISILSPPFDCKYKEAIFCMAKNNNSEGDVIFSANDPICYMVLKQTCSFTLNQSVAYQPPSKKRSSVKKSAFGKKTSVNFDSDDIFNDGEDELFLRVDL